MLGTGFFLVVVLTGLVALGVPVGFAMIGASAAWVGFQESVPFVVIPHMMLSGLDAFPLLSIPFFLFVGELMGRTGYADRLVSFATMLVSRFGGGVAHACIVSGLLLGGVSGLAVADTVLLGTVFIPSMKQRGYPGGFAAALTAACGAIDPIMPPSVLMIVYGCLTGVSVARLFLGGVVPALLMAAYLMVASTLFARKKGYTPVKAATGGEIGRSFLGNMPSLAVGVIILGGIVGGFFTPTESSAVAAAFLVLIGLATRSLSGRDLNETVAYAARITGQVLFIIAAGAPIRWILTVSHFGDPVGKVLLGLSGGHPVLLLFLITVTLLVVACFIDALPHLILLAPILAPLTAKAGIDPVHFGVVMILALCIGFLTPPVGVCMYIVCAIGDVSVPEYLRHFTPIFIALVLVLWTLVLVPGLVLFLPNLLLGPTG